MSTDLLQASSTAKWAAAQLQKALYEQSSRLMELFTPLGPNRLLLETLSGWERVDAGGFKLTLTALCDDAHIPLKALIAQPVCVRMQTSDGQGRAFHGHVTSFSLEGANGGFARYSLTVEPWSALLRYRQDSYLFQDKSVFDIVDEVFGGYQGGNLVPSWRWEVADRSVYPVRSLTTQYQESDLAFVQRILAEEGLYYWFEHDEPDEEASVPGRHTMVIADHASAWKMNPQPQVSFQRADATEPLDSLQVWHGQRQMQTNALQWHSWDYRQVDRRPQQLDSHHNNSERRIALTQWDDPGVYAWETTEQAERLQNNALQALEVRNKVFHGQSTVRLLMPGTRFSLTGHAEHDLDEEQDREFAVLQVEHHGRNNFNEDLRRAVRFLLDAPEQPDTVEAAAPEFDYWNELRAVRSNVPYRPLLVNAQGLRIHPRPTVQGSQTALVIGTEEQLPVHTDRDDRIKIQFHWQRGSRSSLRSAHPDGDDNAPGSDKLGVWVRVAASVAGDNWGQVTLPRVGQEVIVDFMHGDIDRPVVTGVLYNGKGVQDAQSNQVQNGAAVATGNAPSWFAGQSGEYAHHAVYSGIKTQALSASQRGDGGFNQLVFDDTPGQESTQLSTTQASTRLHVGHQRQQNDNQRGEGRGHGAELASEAHGAVRAGAGLLISADSQPQGVGSFLDSQPSQAVLEQAQDVALSLADNAGKQMAALDGDDQASELPALKALQHIHEVISATEQGQASAGGASASGPGQIKAAEGGAGTVTAYAEPHMQFSAPKGVLWATPAEAVLVNGATGILTAGQDINVAAQQQISVGVRSGVALYTVGGEASGGDPLQERGIRLHAANGNVQVQSLAGEIKAAAQDKVTIASTGDELQISAPEHSLFTAAGAYVKLDGDSVRIHAPGAVTFRAGRHNFVGPQAMSQATSKPSSHFKGCSPEDGAAALLGAAFLPSSLPTGSSGAPGLAADDVMMSLAKEGDIASGAQDNWSMSDLIEEFCPDDAHILDAMAERDVYAADRLYSTTYEFSNGEWVEHEQSSYGLFYPGTGEDGKGHIMFDRTASLDEAANTLYHEVTHSLQSDDVSRYEREVDAFMQTEDWAIRKGMPPTGGRDYFRKVDAQGNVSPNEQGIRDFVTRAYRTDARPEQVVKDFIEPNISVLEDGTQRLSQEGDLVYGDRFEEGTKLMPRSMWKCPPDNEP